MFSPVYILFISRQVKEELLSTLSMSAEKEYAETKSNVFSSLCGVKS